IPSLNLSKSRMKSEKCRNFRAEKVP
ncbi:response regulator, partial [Vibrio parahaemolyticus V-223/04]